MSLFFFNNKLMSSSMTITSFTGKETIIEILNKLPEAEDILIAHGLHCVGCSMGGYETLEEGCQGHGFSSEELQDILDNLNLQLNEKKIQISQPLKLTKEAEKKLILFQKQQKKMGYGVKIDTTKTRGNWNYSLDFCKTPKKEWVTINTYKIKLFLSTDSNDQLYNHTIDYIKTSDGEGFKFTKNN